MFTLRVKFKGESIYQWNFLLINANNQADIPVRLWFILGVKIRVVLGVSQNKPYFRISNWLTFIFGDYDNMLNKYMIGVIDDKPGVISDKVDSLSDMIL